MGTPDQIQQARSQATDTVGEIVHRSPTPKNPPGKILKRQLRAEHADIAGPE